MTRHRASRSRLVGAVTTVVVALAALGVTAAVMAGKPGVVDQIAADRLTEIEQLAPLDTHQLVLTPGLGQGNEWWNSVIAFMPPVVRLDSLKPTADLGITHLGYSFSAADPALGLAQRYVRMLYVETDSAAHAGKVQGWLSTSVGAAQGAFWSAVNGHTVVVTTSDIPTSAVSRKGAGLGSTAAYRQDTAHRDPGSLIWEDWGAYVKAAGASGGKPAQYSRFFYGATGFIKGSRWVGYATSPQVGWSGRFQSGGVDSTLVSATDVAAAIQSYEKVLSKDKNGNLMAVDGGAGNYLRSGFFVKHPGLTADRATMGSAKFAFKPMAEGDTAFSFDPALWLAGTSPGGGARQEGLSLFAYSINGKQINLKVTVNEALRKALLADKTPVKTLAPPPGPPPGSRPVIVPTDNPAETGRPAVG